MTAASGDLFPGSSQTLLHLGNDPFEVKIYDERMTREQAFVSVDVGADVKILTRYSGDLRRLADTLVEAADRLDQLDGSSRARKAAADAWADQSVLL